MSKIYKVNNTNSTTVEMPMVFCKNEDKELQQLLLKNHDMLPGDQIDPVSPRRWLLIKREMPVPNPSSGSDTWSIDFLFGDQDATPTLVECKRFADTRARREIIGQVFEYAANGHHYWNKATLHEYAAQENVNRPGSFEQLATHDFPSPDAYFEEMERRLRAGEIRIVFFLERAPLELRSIVEFLNEQMPRVQILLVEASQHELNGIRVVSPRLFGYTEETRMAKAAASTSNSTGSRRQWDEESFFKDALEKLQPPNVDAIRGFLKHAQDLGYAVSWGTGIASGSFNIRHTDVSERSFLSVYSDGRLIFNAGYINDGEVAKRARDFLKDNLRAVGMENLEISYPTWREVPWQHKGSAISTILDALLEHIAAKFDDRAE